MSSIMSASSARLQQITRKKVVDFGNGNTLFKFLPEATRVGLGSFASV
jgi:hypothetical protein